MENKKLIATFLCVSMLMTLGGCNKSEVKETNAEEDEEATEQATGETETTETEETSEETEKTEETEDTEGSTESTKGTYYDDYAGDESEFSKIYTDFRNFATELNESDGDLLYGFGKNDASDVEYSTVWEYVLLVYDGFEVMAYHDVNGNIEQVEQEYLGYVESVWDPEKFLFEYEDFMEYPFLDDFPLFADIYFQTEVDPKNLDAVLEDGEYGGSLHGFSADMKYVYAQIGPECTISKSMEDCLSLKEGDRVKYDGEMMEVTSAEFCDEKYSPWFGCYVITLGEVEDGGGDMIVISVDDNGNAKDMSILDFVGYPLYPYYKLSKVPIAEDAEINIDVYWGDEFAGASTIKGSELQNYISNSIDIYPELTAFEDGGVKINEGAGLGLDIKDGTADTLRIENGEIVYMSFKIWNW